MYLSLVLDICLLVSQVRIHLDTFFVAELGQALASFWVRQQKPFANTPPALFF